VVGERGREREDRRRVVRARLADVRVLRHAHVEIRPGEAGVGQIHAGGVRPGVVVGPDLGDLADVLRRVACRREARVPGAVSGRDIDDAEEHEQDVAAGLGAVPRQRTLVDQEAHRVGAPRRRASHRARQAVPVPYPGVLLGGRLPPDERSVEQRRVADVRGAGPILEVRGIAGVEDARERAGHVLVAAKIDEERTDGVARPAERGAVAGDDGGELEPAIEDVLVVRALRPKTTANHRTVVGVRTVLTQGVDRALDAVRVEQQDGAVRREEIEGGRHAGGRPQRRARADGRAVADAPRRAQCGHDAESEYQDRTGAPHRPPPLVTSNAARGHAAQGREERGCAARGARAGPT
jgi:hypothetical protein